MFVKNKNDFYFKDIRILKNESGTQSVLDASASWTRPEKIQGRYLEMKNKVQGSYLDVVQDASRTR